MEAQAAVVEPEQAHHAHTTQRSQNTVAAPAIGKRETLHQRGDVNVRARLHHVCRSSRRPRCDSWFSIFFGTSSPQPTMLTFGAHVSIIFPPHLVDDGCGDALRAWVVAGGFVHAACALRISAATSGSPTSVIDFGIFEPTAFSRNCLLYTSPSPRDRTRSRMPSSA